MKKRLTLARLRAAVSTMQGKLVADLLKLDQSRKSIEVVVCVDQPLRLSSIRDLSSALENVYRHLFYVPKATLPPGVNRSVITEAPILLSDDSLVVPPDALEQRNRALELKISKALSYGHVRLRFDFDCLKGADALFMYKELRRFEIFVVYGNQVEYPAIDRPSSNVLSHTHLVVSYDPVRNVELVDGVKFVQMPMADDLLVYLRFAQGPMDVLLLDLDLNVLMPDLDAGRLPSPEQIRALTASTLENEVIGMRVTAEDKDGPNPKILMSPIVQS